MNDELIGWGEITMYLKCCRATAWNWAQRYGMPVISLPSGQVRASKAEIKAWIILNDKKARGLDQNRQS